MARLKAWPSVSVESLWGEGFVGGWAVDAGDGQVVEAEVDAELGAVVDHVAEEGVSEGTGAGVFADDVAAVGELPGLQ